MTPEELETTVRNLKDRQDIRDCISTYCRAIDRLDRNLMLSVFHPDAILDYGFLLGSREDFIEMAFAMHREGQLRTYHGITNHLCEVDGDVAHAESYYLHASMNREGPPLNMRGGRYIDRLERRDGRWAIAERMVLFEWWGTPADNAFIAWEIADPDNTEHAIHRDHNDPSYRRPFHIAAKTPIYRRVASAAAR